MNIGLPDNRVREAPRFALPVVVILPPRAFSPVPDSVRLARGVEAPIVPRLIVPEPFDIEKS